MDLKDLTHSSSFGSLVNTISTKLISTGTLQIVTDIPKESELFNNLYKEILSNGLADCPADTKSYFSTFDLNYLNSPPYNSKPYLHLFCLRQIQ